MPTASSTSGTGSTVTGPFTGASTGQITGSVLLGLASQYVALQNHAADELTRRTLDINATERARLAALANPEVVTVAAKRPFNWAMVGAIASVAAVLFYLWQTRKG